MRKLQSSQSFTVTTVRDGVTVTCSPASITVPCTEAGVVNGTFTVTLNLAWTMKAGGRALTVSSVAVGSKSIYVTVTKNSNTSFSLSVPNGLSKSELDKGITFNVTGGGYTVACFFALIASIKGAQGDGGKDAATLVFEPDVVFVPCDSDGMCTDAVNKSVAFFIEINGTRYTPDSNTATAQVVGQDIDYTFSNNKTILNVYIGSGYSDIEGYIKVTATKTLNGVTYTASGCLPVVASLQGESGPRGKTGPMAYLVGEYDSTVNYGALLTDTRCPVVHYVNGTTDQYWYPTAGYRGAGYAPSTANGWAQADRFEMVVTKVLFTQFAKLGGFVVSGDYMLSQYGELIDADGNRLALTEQTDSDGSTHWRYNGVDAYTYFQGYDPMVEYGVLPSIQTRQGVNWQYWNYYETTSAEFYMPVQATEANADNTGKLVSLVAGDHYYIYGKDQSGVQHCIIVRVTRYNSTNRRLYGYREKSVGEYVPLIYSATARIFRPVRCVNAATGEEWTAGGNMHVSGSGNLEVEGTIRAKNLYRNVCVFVDGGTYFNRNGERWFYNPTTKLYELSPESTSGKEQCVYDADIIFMLGRGASGWNTNEPVLLPRAEDFPGKMVEVIVKCDMSGGGTVYIGAVGGTRNSSTGNYTGPDVMRAVTSAVPTGDKYNLQSFQTANNCYPATPGKRTRWVSMPDTTGAYKWVLLDEL